MKQSMIPNEQPPAYSEVAPVPKVESARKDTTSSLLVTSTSLAFDYQSSLSNFDISTTEWDHFTSALSSSASLSLAEKSKAVAAGVALGAVSGWPWLGVGVGMAIWRREIKEKITKGDVMGVMKRGLERSISEHVQRQAIVAENVQTGEDVGMVNAMVSAEDAGSKGDADSEGDVGSEGDVDSENDMEAVLLVERIEENDDVMSAEKGSTGNGDQRYRHLEKDVSGFEARELDQK
ncbi:MAG: hypothetical protein Q9222_007448 [Ikaeria aurantiellina]